MDLSEELVGLFALLEQCDLKYAACGEIGAAFQGSSQLTSQLELLIPAEVLDSFVSAASEREFRAAGKPVPWNPGSGVESSVQVLTKGKSPDTLALQLILLPAALAEAWKQRRVYLWREKKVQVLPADGLAKIKAGRDGKPSASGTPLDLSASAIARRIQDKAKSYELGVSLRGAKFLGSAEELLAKQG